MVGQIFNLDFARQIFDPLKVPPTMFFVPIKSNQSPESFHWIDSPTSCTDTFAPKGQYFLDLFDQKFTLELWSSGSFNQVGIINEAETFCNVQSPIDCRQEVATMSGCFHSIDKNRANCHPNGRTYGEADIYRYLITGHSFTRSGEWRMLSSCFGYRIIASRRHLPVFSCSLWTTH